MDENQTTVTEQGADQAAEQHEKSYTQAEVDEMLKGRKSADEIEEIIKVRVAREKKVAEKAAQLAADEAAKLAKMNADEKAKYEKEKLLKELEELRKEKSYHALSKEALTMLSEQGITANDDLLAMVVKDTAEDTKAAVQAFTALVNTVVEGKVKEALSGTPPKAQPGNEPPDIFAKKLKKWE